LPKLIASPSRINPAICGSFEIANRHIAERYPTTVVAGLEPRLEARGNADVWILPLVFEFRGHHTYLRRWSSGDIISISDVGVVGHRPCLPTLPAGTVTSAAGRRLERHPELRMSPEGRCRAVWLVIFETGRALAFAMFEPGRAINDGAIHTEL
jgi:hypothetical protein